MKYRQAISAGWVCLGLLGSGGLLSAKVGFGLIKKYIQLQARQPAAVRLANTSVFFEGASTNKEYFPVQESLLITLGTELISHEKSLVVKDKRSDAEWTFVANITGFSVSPPVTQTERSGNETVTYVVWSGSLNVAYRVIDKQGIVYDAANVEKNYHERFQSGVTGTGSKLDLSNLTRFKKKSNKAEVVPGTQEDVKQILIKDVVRQIAGKLGNTTQSLDVQVATGEANLNHAAEFMNNGLWSRALDALQKAPTFPKPEEEAFHQYDLGLTYEAMSYDSKSSAEQRENIFKAAEYYDKALELSPNEKYFVETIARARDAVARYKALDQMLAEDRKNQAKRNEETKKGGDAKTIDNVGAKGPQTPSKVVKLSDVIDMRNAEVSDDVIAEYIRSASKVEFDPTDKDTIISMAKAKLSLKLQNELRIKAGLQPLSAPRQARNTPDKKTQ